MNASTSNMPPQGLPEGWKTVWNEEHQQWFYVNPSTSVSTWHRPQSPPAGGGAGAASPALGMDTQSHDQTGEPDHAYSRRQDDLVYEKEILADYTFDDPSTVSDAAPAWSRQHSCRVLVKRYSKLDPARVAAAQRELNALNLLGRSDNAIPPLIDYFDPADTVFVVCENRQDESLRQYIEGRGPLTGDLLKAVVTQLMSAMANIFMNGFVHLNMTNETLFIDQNGQLTIKDFQYAVPYGAEKIDDLYAAVGHDVNGADGVWRAPEVFAAQREGTNFNGRKAAIWSCGVVIYYMLTGQLERLSSLNHPAFSSRQPSIMSNPAPVSSTEPSTNIPEEAAKPRRLSLTHRRRSSANNASAGHARKSSHSLSTPQPLIPYPGNRFELAQYARDIVSKMLIVNPLIRAELIEVAAKVPKEFVTKGTRPLMELAWLDYKSHVGPYAGLGIGANAWDGGAGDDSSSVYSGISALSQSFTGLLSGRRQSKSKQDYYG